MLERLGWGSFFEAAWNESPRNGAVPGRVVSQHRGCQRVAGQFGEADAEVTGKFRHDAAEGGLWPAVGDWVVIDGAPGNRMRINAVLPRRTEIARKTAGRSIEPQILAANVDFAFVMTGLDGDYNLRRLERYLALAWESGVRPIVILNKKELCGECVSRVAEAKQVALGAP